MGREVVGPVANEPTGHGSGRRKVRLKLKGIVVRKGELECKVEKAKSEQYEWSQGEGWMLRKRGQENTRSSAMQGLQG